MSELLKNPKLMEEAQTEVRQVFNRKGTVDETGIHELKFLKSVIKETLRLHPPGSLIPRECRMSCEINGYNMPRRKFSLTHGQLVEIQNIGSKPRGSVQRDFLTVQLITKGWILSISLSVQEGGCVLEYQWLLPMLSCHLHNCYTTLIGNFPVD